MSALLQVLVPAYVALAAALALALTGVRGAAWALARAGRPLSSRQRLQVARGALALAVLVPLLVASARELAPTGPLFAFERSVVRATGRLPAAASWAPAEVRPTPQRAAPSPAGSAMPLAAGLIALAAAGLWTLRLRQQARLLARLEALPRVRRVGSVCVALGAEDAPAFSVWFPRRRGRVQAWVVVPAGLLAQPEALRLTVMHELQHHRQGDTRLAYARLALVGLFPWHPAAHLFSRWLAACGELACDEALVQRARVRPQAYAQVLLEAALRPGPLPAGAAGMSHPTARRIEMLFRPRPTRRAPASAVLALTALLLAPLAVWAQSAARPRTVTLAQAQALAQEVQGGLPVVVDAQVLDRLNRLVGTPKGRAFMQRALENLKVQREPLARALREHGLPEDLLAVAVIESAVTNLPETDGSPSLAPGLRGAGVWMFIPETARHYGLTVEAGRDDRLDVARETQAFAVMISELHARYGDWRLALAAYNQGEKKVDAALAQGASRDVTALAAAGLLNEYAASVQAGLLLMRNPQLLD